MLGIYNNYLHGAKSIGSTWAPKQQRLMVGRDLASIHKAPEKEKDHAVILANSIKQYDTASGRMNWAASQTSLGFSLKEKINISPNGSEQMLASGSRESVYLVQDKSGMSLRIKNAGGEEQSIRLDGKDDIRISWNKDGSAEVFTGEAAKINGKLAAQGTNDVLVRFSNVNVEAGTGSTVLNLSAHKGGKFGGGHNVRYLGSYTDADIQGGTGVTGFEGNFSSGNITATRGRGEFSGVFSGFTPGSGISTGGFDDVFDGYFHLVDIKSSGGDNTFSGVFMAGSNIEGGTGNDIYSGEFFDSSIKDAGGDNTFGSYADLKEKVKNNFVRTVIESGAGNDKLLGMSEESKINLGGGDDEVDAILRGTGLETGDGQDKVRIIYGSASIIDAGAGDDTLHLVTGSGNSVRLGEGDDAMTSGLNSGGHTGNTGTLGAFGKSVFMTEQEAEKGLDPRFAQHMGDVQASKIDASLGENNISVHDGLNVHTVKTGVQKSEEEGAAPQATSDDKPGYTGFADAQTASSAGKKFSLAQTLEKMLDKVNPDMRSRLEKALEELKAEQVENDGDARQRYLATSLGGWLPNPGGHGVTVDGGGGQAVSFDRMERHMFDREEKRSGGPLGAALHKYRSFGGVNS